MNAWKKIAAIFGLSAAAALVGSACTAQVGDATEPLDPAAPVEVTEEAESELSIDQPRPPNPRAIECERRCHRQYQKCLDSGYPRSFCKRELRLCIKDCQ